MTLVIEDALIDQLCAEHVWLRHRLNNIEKQLHSVMDPHHRADCGAYRIVLCDDGTAVVYERGAG